MLDTLRSEYGITHITAAMSGAFTQRGECAVFDKYTRTKAALCAGADLVVSLPFVYSAQNAQTFAIGSVYTALLTQSEYLAFGCEHDDISVYAEAVKICSSAAFKKMMSETKHSKEPYPQKRIEALNALGGKDFSFLREANNILAFEYLKALSETAGGKVKPIAVKRIGALHSSEAPVGEYASATYIRKLIYEGNYGEALRYMPRECAFTHESLSSARIFSQEELTDALKAVILITPPEKLSEICDMQDGMQNLFKANLRLLNDGIQPFAEAVSGKRISLSRVRRCLVDMLLGCTKADNADVKNSPPAYIRVLGANDRGRELINIMKQNDSLTVITKLADGCAKLSPRDKRIIGFDIAAEDAVRFKEGISGCDYLYTPYILS